MIRIALALVIALLPWGAAAQDVPSDPTPFDPMTADRLAEIVLMVDPEARLAGSGIEFSVDGVQALLVVDPIANRMRIMVHVTEAEELSDEELRRVMQANFDTALDARYAIASGQLWSVFIHPLAELQDRQFVSGVLQSVALAETFGTTYSSGQNLFSGGDSTELLRNWLQGEEI